MVKEMSLILGKKDKKGKNLFWIKRLIDRNNNRMLPLH